MRILLIGEYSNVHWALAEGLRALGHEVDVVSDGDSWKNYSRDIDLRRRSLGRFDSLRYLWDVQRLMPRLAGYDVVQLINPVFLDLRGERIWPYYERLRRQNGRIVMGAFGIDRYWVSEGLKPDTFRYSDFYLDGKLRRNADNDVMVRDWLNGPKGELNRRIADDCDHIVTGLYEYHRCYQTAEDGRYRDKSTYIPFPINLSSTEPIEGHPDYDGLRFFIGIQKSRSAYKGTDVMLEALNQLKARHPEAMEIVRAESVPFPVYKDMMNRSDVLLDQLYSYTPGMNGLLAMSKGLVLVGGGEEEHYDLLGEHELRPIVNVEPHLESVIDTIERRLLLRPEDVAELSRQSVEYVRRHHDHIAVARRYVELYESL